MTLAIHTCKLTRQFPGGFGVRDLQLNVPVGAIYGFLGPNGAGKTTTIRLLLDLLRPQAGQISLFGRPLTRATRQTLGLVGALVESPSLYRHLSGRENLEVTRRLIGAPRRRVDDVLEKVGLAEAAGRRVGEYSLGMRQRLAVALALLGAPRLLILDEPSNGLDPAGVVDMRNLLRSLVADDGITVFISSHLLAEMEQIATHVGVLQAGRLRFEGRLDELRARSQAQLELRCDAAARAADLLSAASEQIVLGDDGTIRVALDQRSVEDINRLLVSHGIGVSHLAIQSPSLESLFFDLTAPADNRDAA